jgi:hypothetical protein
MAVKLTAAQKKKSKALLDSVTAEINTRDLSSIRTVDLLKFHAYLAAQLNEDSADLDIENSENGESVNMTLIDFRKHIASKTNRLKT